MLPIDQGRSLLTTIITLLMWVGVPIHTSRFLDTYPGSNVSPGVS
jgi:hypothetical protein